MTKKFFKITWFKIVVALGISLFNFFVKLLYGRSKIVYEGVVKFEANFFLRIIYFIFQVLFLPIDYVNSFVSKLHNPESFIVLLIVIYLGYNYVIACIIVSIFKIPFKKEGIIKSIDNPS